MNSLIIIMVYYGVITLNALKYNVSDLPRAAVIPLNSGTSGHFHDNHEKE